MRRFAEEEIVLPNGPFENRRFSCDRQPYAGLWFDAIDSGKWRRFAATGPSQSGKTVCCSVIPVLYHLFELRETVIFGLPDMAMAADKWREDLLPVIERSRFRRLLPTSGAGSKGGQFESIKFQNGATLRFMSGGGDDKSRSAFTSRVLVVTEADGLDASSSTSREADKLKQLEARTRAYGERARIYLECTVSIEEGRIWREYKNGTRTRIMTPCPKCGHHVCLEREDLKGWQEAADEIEAKELAAFVCSSCSTPWTEADRLQANQGAKLVHAGQLIDSAGVVTGNPKRTETLGFRWSAVNNLFTTAGQHGGEEWAAARSKDAENAEKERRQFAWAIPYVPPQWDLNPLDEEEIITRFHEPRMPRGQVAEECEILVAAADLRKRELHYIVLGSDLEATGLVVDYSIIEVKSDLYGVQQALTEALHQFRDLMEAGFNWPAGGNPWVPDHVWIDAGYQPDVVHDCCLEFGEHYRPVFGQGFGQHQKRFNRPRAVNETTVLYVGQEFYLARDPARPQPHVNINSDHWKTQIQEAFSLQKINGKHPPGSFTLFSASPRDHLKYAQHLTAEKPRQEHKEGVGWVTVWETIRRTNHWLDCTYIAAAASSFGGARRVPLPDPEPEDDDPPPVPKLTMPDGRPFLITER